MGIIVENVSARVNRRAVAAFFIYATMLEVKAVQCAARAVARGCWVLPNR